MALSVCSCAEKPRDGSTFSTGLNALEKNRARPAADVDPDSLIDARTQSRLDLMEQAQRNSEVSVDARPVRSPRPRSEGSPQEAQPVEPASGESDELTSVSGELQTGAAQPGGTAVSREALVAELAAQLREQARNSSAPAAALLRLATLELLDSGAGTTDRSAEATLTPREAEFLKAWRELFAAARDGLNSSGDIGPLAAQMTALAERVQAAQPLSVIEARLCLRVDGFGMFDEMPRREAREPYTFIAGKRARAIVYIELSNFLHAPKQQGGVDGYEVRLSQELTLYHSARDGDTIVWRRPFQDIVDFSRKRRRDFYTTQVIELPPNLGVGSYRLKVTINDHGSDSSAEAMIPIDFVAEMPASPR